LKLCTEAKPRMHNFLFVLHSSIYKQQIYNKSLISRCNILFYLQADDIGEITYFSFKYVQTISKRMRGFRGRQPPGIKKKTNKKCGGPRGGSPLIYNKQQLKYNNKPANGFTIFFFIRFTQKNIAS